MKIALFGNPNTGKSSVFNLLTGLRQHIGNFAGITVEKKSGSFQIDNQQHQLIDFPGVYSIYPRSKDEEVVYKVVSNPKHPDFPDLAMIVVDASNLERNLLLFTQIYDLKIPIVLVLNMWDLAQKRGINIDIEQLQSYFPSISIVTTNARIGLGKDRLIQAIKNHQLIAASNLIVEDFKLCELENKKKQEEETQFRYQFLKKVIAEIEIVEKTKTDTLSRKIDKILIHPIFGYLIFSAVLFVIFQFIFSFASIPMDFIDAQTTNFSNFIANQLPAGLLNDLICQGIIPGIGGVVIFVPQIALLFLFISILEESGYLSRVVFIMDRLMRPFGLNGKSVVPLISSVACAIPGVMATRTIADWKERLITILVAPLMSCSARIPVYTLLIALVIPKQTVLGIFNLQGIVLFGLYFLGLISALFIAIILNLLIKKKEKGFLLLELPSYKMPRWPNVGINVLEKVKIFVIDAGKIILSISIILWALATFGPSGKMENAEKYVRANPNFTQLPEEEQNQKVASARLESSYIGIFGKAIEPAIRPLGYDWKIGISLITSFAAREVFVGSLATIYAVQDDGDENLRLIDRLKAEKNNKNEPIFTLASGVSLMIFYVFAMQCMATLAVVRRETNSWKWPLIQVAFMGFMAYFGALFAFTILS
jgi:ferrous iron transport protein B